MRVGIECLLADDPLRARDLAEKLSAINSERRDLQAAMVEQAEQAVAAWLSANGGELPCGVVLFDDSWHHGIVGLVASRSEGFAAAAGRSRARRRTTAK